MTDSMTYSTKPLHYRKYPSTTALQCFETAARHLSFTNAALELHMTQSAVSKQVAQLEEMINIPLFYRSSHKISLTPAGKRYYIDVHNILKNIEAATTALMSRDENTEVLKIASHPTFSARWLIPALKGFSQSHPLIHLEVKEQVGPFFSEDSEVDIAFLYGDGVWTGMKAIKLFDEYCIAVCRPDYLSRISDLHDIELNSMTLDTTKKFVTPVSVAPSLQTACQTLPKTDTKNYTLLQLSSRPSAWYEYFRQQSIQVDNTFVGPRFDTFYTCISAALSGCGVALVPMRLVEPELRSGDLVMAWDFAAKGHSAYYMAYPLTLGDTHKVKTIINWITDYLAASNDNEVALKTSTSL